MAKPEATSYVPKGLRISPRTLGKFECLKNILTEMENVLVAFSGGADSTLLLKVAVDVLGKKVLAVTAKSKTYPEKEIREAKKLARSFKARHLVIKTHELENPDFVSNTPQRCYYCKQELFSRLREIAEEEKIPYVLDASNYEDRLDFRPGLKAGKKLGIRSPLKEVGLLKGEIRQLSRYLGLSTWAKPSLACLASRFPYYTKIEKKSLKQIGAAEDFLRSLAFRQVRVRHHGSVARIEVDPDEFPKIIQKGIRQKITNYLKKIGYTYIALDLIGYRTGSMNEPLKKVSSE
jgi:uncharacterized protein